MKVDIPLKKEAKINQGTGKIQFDFSVAIFVTGERIVGFIPFPRVLVKGKLLHSGFELGWLSPLPTTITVMPQIPLNKKKVS